MTFANHIADWGGFEKLVAELHETGDVTVERNVKLPGRSGAPRQIDVLIRHRKAFYDHLVVVECKYWKSPVKRLHVDALATTVREVGADKGVMFSSKGFQEGAVTQALHENIDLFLVRDLKQEEWGRPGRIVDIFMQVAQIGVGPIAVEGGFQPNRPGELPAPGDLNLPLNIADGNPVSRTPLLRPDGSLSQKTLEQSLIDAFKEGAMQTLNRSLLFNGGADGTYYLNTPVTLTTPGDFRIPRRHGTLVIPAFALKAGLKITQSRVTVDRAKNLDFALAVESKVTGDISLAARETGLDITSHVPIKQNQTDPENPALQNGQVLSMLTTGYFDMSEMAHLEPVDIESIRRPVVYVDPNRA